MNFTRTSLALAIVTVFGMGFSGYLSAGVLLASSCPLNGGCTRVLGLPSCIYGFVMYTVMLFIVLLTWSGKLAFLGGRKLIFFVSVIGMLFAGSLLIEEFANKSPLTICAVGFTMYLLIFALSASWKKN